MIDSSIYLLLCLDTSHHAVLPPIMSLVKVLSPLMSLVKVLPPLVVSGFLLTPKIIECLGLGVLIPVLIHGVATASHDSPPEPMLP